MICPECGAENYEPSRPCASCGRAATPASPRRWLLWLALAVAAVAALILTIPNPVKEPRFPMWTYAVGGVRTINEACITYRAAYPRRGFPPSLTALAPPTRGATPSPEAADLIEPNLATGMRSGYRFSYRAFDRDGDGVHEAYTINADPIEPDTERRHAFSNESGVVRWELDKPTNEESEPIQ